MRIHLLKLTITLSLGILFTIYSLNGSSVRANQNGPEASLTGAPNEATCTACHGGGPSGGTLSITGLPANYSPNQDVTLTVTLSQANRGRYGFQLTAIDDSGKRAGDLTPNDNRTQTQTNTVLGNSRQYINHTFAGITPSAPGQGSWTFKWKAPAQSVGRVTFYIAGNAANGNNANSLDYIYITNASMQPATTLPQVAAVSAASFSSSLASEAIASIFGKDLASGSLPATTQPLPTVLGDTRVKVKDNVGMERDAGLFFAAPWQINFLIPAGTSNGMATVTVSRDNTPVGAGNVMIDTTAPALFAGNSNGAGIAAALVFRVKATGERT